MSRAHFFPAHFSPAHSRPLTPPPLLPAHPPPHTHSHLCEPARGAERGHLSVCAADARFGKRRQAFRTPNPTPRHPTPPNPTARHPTQPNPHPSQPNPTHMAGKFWQVSRRLAIPPHPTTPIFLHLPFFLYTRSESYTFFRFSTTPHPPISPICRTPPFPISHLVFLFFSSPCAWDARRARTAREGSHARSEARDAGWSRET